MGRLRLWLFVIGSMIANGSSQTLPDIWTIVEDSYESDVLVTFESIVSFIKNHISSLIISKHCQISKKFDE